VNYWSVTVRHPTLVYVLAFVTLLGFGAFSAVMGDSPAQDNPTQQQQTIDAAIGQLFTQTAESQGQFAITQTVEAGFQQALTATAGFATTVQAGFDRALTTTAEAQLVITPSAVATLTATESVMPGTAHVILRPDLPADGYTTADVNRAADVIEGRLSELSIAPTSVEVQQDGSIVVEFPALAGIDEVVSTLQETALLEFVDFSGLSAQVQDFIGKRILTSEQVARENPEDTPSATEDWLVNPLTDEPFQTVLTGAALQAAQAMILQQTQEWGVQFELTPEGAAIFGPFTESHVGEPMAIVLDSVVVSAPTIQSRLDEGGVINGGFTEETATKLALQLRSGALPIPLRVDNVEITEVTLTPTATMSESMTPTPTVTALPTIFPTATTAEIQVAEQVFEGGRMLWVQPTDQIWVLVVTETGHGTWTVYNDTFEEGDPEFDPNIVPPQGLYQPTRGFGKLWRENVEVREALGWASTPEFGYVSPYEYHPGGEVVDDEYIPGPGYHILYSLYGEQFRFNEADGTWELGSRE
jgi:hypothetical protein